MNFNGLESKALNYAGQYNAPLAGSNQNGGNGTYFYEAPVSGIKVFLSRFYEIAVNLGLEVWRNYLNGLSLPGTREQRWEEFKTYLFTKGAGGEGLLPTGSNQIPSVAVPSGKNVHYCYWSRSRGDV